MAAKQVVSLPNRLAGKKVVFNGKFDYGQQERLQAMAEAQQGTIVEDLSASVDYLVLPDLTAGKTIQKKAASLNAKGATVQAVDAVAFNTMVEPTESEVLVMIRNGKDGVARLGKMTGHRYIYYHGQQNKPQYNFTGERFDGLNLTGFDFRTFRFDRCNFSEAALPKVFFGCATNCDFSKAVAPLATFGSLDGSRFINATLNEAQFHDNITNVDFSSALLDKAKFLRNLHGLSSHTQLSQPGVIFDRARLQSARFVNISLKTPNFEQADLLEATLVDCWLESANLRGAILRGATLIGCKLADADLSGADLSGANLAGADLSRATLDGADLNGCNLRGTNLHGVNLSKAKNYNPSAIPSGKIGPALTELDALAKQARRIHIAFHVSGGKPDDSELVCIDTNRLQYGWGLRLPQSINSGFNRHSPGQTASDAMVRAANMLGHHKVRFETVDVSSTKSPKSGKELRELVINGISEAFVQVVPPADELAAATKAWREKDGAANAAVRAQRAAALQAAADQKKTAKKQIAKKIAKKVGKVTDVATFLKALELRIEKPKIDKATKMLKASGFKLFNDVTDTHLNGVVKSQTDPDLVYACRIEAAGNYACCTQNLNICGGLRGSICKHLLVLIIGLVQAGELDPTTIDTWIAKSHDTKAELNKETMGEIFIRYKGAEAGEVDWRPTQTVPEDYYTL